jgi:hypothetical protein
MRAITVRNVPDRVRDELAARAAHSGRSLQEYLLIHLIEITSRSQLDDVVARARARTAAARTHLEAAEIVAARDADRR